MIMSDNEKLLKESGINDLIGAILILDLSNVNFSVKSERELILKELMTRDQSEVLNSLFSIIREF